MNPPPAGKHRLVLEQLAELLGPLARRVGLVSLVREFGLGEGEENYRVPDGGLHRTQPEGVWHATAALVIEVVSPGDETWTKLDCYAAHDVDELLIVDPQERRVHWFALQRGKYEPVERSALIELGSAELAERLVWP